MYHDKSQEKSYIIAKTKVNGVKPIHYVRDTIKGVRHVGVTTMYCHSQFVTLGTNELTIKPSYGK